ncbi:Cytolysin/lectin [Suillus subaureus]|uniref:Cytolysin/lectin n=1 Tax=Suillus subaureus TaxID=48587 RepID=A0A9P7E4H4_9AGAM|nr:Cytolysin/lectin [Suillus subaureus]KAG1810955.1 Cytolysin/lectin [Suillus subaureus]
MLLEKGNAENRLSRFLIRQNRRFAVTLVSRSSRKLRGTSGTWSNTDSIGMLVMGGSGTSGALRFTGEEFLVTTGIHNYNVQCNAVTDRAHGDTGLKIHIEY